MEQLDYNLLFRWFVGMYLGHLLIENRHGLIADAMATIADGFAEREAATLMVHEQWQRAPT